MDARSFFLSKNTQSSGEELKFTVQSNVFVGKLPDELFRHKLVIDASVERVMQFRGAQTVCKVMYDTLGVTNRFILGAVITEEESWQSKLVELFSSDCTATVCFVNLRERLCLQLESELYENVEYQKKKALQLRLKGASFVFKKRFGQKQIKFAGNDTREIVVAVIPNNHRGDILFVRSTLLDALPKSKIEKLLNKNSVVCHFGRVKKKYEFETLDCTTLCYGCDTSDASIEEAIRNLMWIDDEN